jgi:hypothetical protein
MKEFKGEIDAIALRDAIVQAIDIAVNGKKIDNDKVLPPIAIRLQLQMGELATGTWPENVPIDISQL